jgi:hypothetical protein
MVGVIYGLDDFDGGECAVSIYTAKFEAGLAWTASGGEDELGLFDCFQRGRCHSNTGTTPHGAASLPGLAHASMHGPRRRA